MSEQALEAFLPSIRLAYTGMSQSWLRGPPLEDMFVREQREVIEVVFGMFNKQRNNPRVHDQVRSLLS